MEDNEKEKEKAGTGWDAPDSEGGDFIGTFDLATKVLETHALQLEYYRLRGYDPRRPGGRPPRYW